MDSTKPLNFPPKLVFAKLIFRSKLEKNMLVSKAPNTALLLSDLTVKSVFLLPRPTWHVSTAIWPSLSKDAHKWLPGLKFLSIVSLSVNQSKALKSLSKVKLEIWIWKSIWWWQWFWWHRYDITVMLATFFVMFVICPMY